MQIVKKILMIYVFKTKTSFEGDKIIMMEKANFLRYLKLSLVIFNFTKIDDKLNLFVVHGMNFMPKSNN